MLSINTNLSSMLVRYNLMQASLGMNNAIEQMTTGYKLNNAKDNAANFGIVTNLNTKISAYQVAEDNCAMGLDMLSTANSTLDQIYDHLQRLRDLAEQASNGTYGEASLRAINSEANAIVDEIERLYNTAEYNGIKLFEGSNGGGADAVSAAFTNESTPIQTYSLARTVTVDESKRVSNVTSLTSGETYYITTSDDLVALQDLVNNGASTRNVTYELANDIDMRGIEFRGIGSLDYGFTGIFKGNGYTISNLTINTTENWVGLFGSVSFQTTITELNLMNANLSGGVGVGGLIGYAFATAKLQIFSCSVEGNISGNSSVGGIIGATGIDGNCYIDNSLSSGTVIGNDSVGGIIGYHGGDAQNAYTNCYSTSVVTGTSRVGALFGYLYDDFEIVGCKYDSTINPGLEALGGYNIMGSIDVQDTDLSNILPPADSDDGETESEDAITSPRYSPERISLQIGTSATGSSQIGVSMNFKLAEVAELRMIGLDSTTDYLSEIDEKLLLIAEKQTELGATENRLNSALEEISTQYENLVSSRSTLRDADIAEVSSEYIRQQILQQASATLLSTANQSASIALALL